MPRVEVSEVGRAAPREGCTTVVVTVFVLEPLVAMITATTAPARAPATIGSTR